MLPRRRKQRYVAIATGGSRGIGRAIAERLAEDGFALVLNYAGNDVEAERAAAAIRATGAQVRTATELSRFGAETAIVVPGVFTNGTNHFPHGGRPLGGRVDPADDGSETVSVVADRIRTDFHRHIGLAEPPHPARCTCWRRSVATQGSVAVGVVICLRTIRSAKPDVGGESLRHKRSDQFDASTLASVVPMTTAAGQRRGAGHGRSRRAPVTMVRMPSWQRVAVPSGRKVQVARLG